jgi:hypothetical protein
MGAWIKLDAKDKATWPLLKEEVLVYIEAINRVIMAVLVFNPVGRWRFESRHENVLDLDMDHITYWAKIEYPPDETEVETRKDYESMD